MRRSVATPSDNGPLAPLARALRGNEKLSQVLTEQLAQMERWRSERAEWQQERKLLRAMIDQVPDYLFVKDTECRFLIANKAVANDLGYQPEAILGKSDLELHAPELAAGFYKVDTEVIRTGQPVLDREEYVVLQNGERRWLSTSKLALKDDSGKIIGLVGISRDITRRKEAEEEVHFLAYHDQLTGLLNRASLEVELRRLQSAERASGSHLLLLLDLDRFKQVNDTLGHAAGDALLRQVGTTLSEVICPSGLVFRIGGDEFAAIVPVTADVSVLCSGLMCRLEGGFRLEGRLAHTGASVGIAPLNCGAVDPMDALREADIALYEAKRQGRGRWEEFRPEMANTLRTRHQLEEELRGALAAPDQIHAIFQPIYSVDRQRLLGVEALARWRHPRDGAIAPSTFIPIAESCGLIGLVGEKVLCSACDLLRNSSLPWVAINVSPLQLRKSDFAATLMGLLNRFAVLPSRIQLEITEGVFLDGAQETIDLLTKLRAAGFRIALDDFGTGFSSLHYLSRFPIDKVKIDRSFVSAIGTRNADAIVGAIVSLAEGLGLTATAEGVETEEQRRYLEKVGCPEIQGYLTGRPLSAERLLS